MLRIQKALWFIESNLPRGPVAMTDVADAAGVSKFQLSRLFAAYLGCSAKTYALGRMLSEAARTLADGESSVIDVAIAAGYSSNEAFTRAFKGRFGLTPEILRNSGSLETLRLTPAARIETSTTIALDPPAIVDVPRRLIAGLARRYVAGADSIEGAPAQWIRFAEHFATMPNSSGDIGYGVNHDFDDDGGFSYLAGVEVSRFDGPSSAFETHEWRGGRQAVYVHRGHVADIPATMRAIWEDWTPLHDGSPMDCSCVEVYGPGFDPETGFGEIEIFLPLARQ